MPAKNPRLMVVMEKPLFYAVQKKAAKHGVSLSTEVRDLVRQALEEDEDLFWARAGEARLTRSSGKAAVAHKKFWGKLGL